MQELLVYANYWKDYAFRWLQISDVISRDGFLLIKLLISYNIECQITMAY